MTNLPLYQKQKNQPRFLSKNT